MEDVLRRLGPISTLLYCRAPFDPPLGGRRPNSKKALLSKSLIVSLMGVRREEEREKKRRERRKRKEHAPQGRIHIYQRARSAL